MGESFQSLDWNQSQQLKFSLPFLLWKFIFSLSSVMVLHWHFHPCIESFEIFVDDHIGDDIFSEMFAVSFSVSIPLHEHYGTTMDCLYCHQEKLRHHSEDICSEYFVIFMPIYKTRVWLLPEYLALPGMLTHWGRVTHICLSKIISIASDNGLATSRRQAIIWTNAGILLIWPLGTNFSEILIKIHISSFKKIYLKMWPAKYRPSCPNLNVLTHWPMGDVVIIPKV